MNLGDLYRQVILDHSQRPRNFHEDADAVAISLRNPTCGDEITLFLNLKNGIVEQASFIGSGCSISQASASMLTEAVRGLTQQEALLLAGEFRNLVQGLPADIERLGDLEALGGVRQFPARIKCATLAWHALEQGIAEERRGDSDERGQKAP